MRFAAPFVGCCNQNLQGFLHSSMRNRQKMNGGIDTDEFDGERCFVDIAQKNKLDSCNSFAWCGFDGWRDFLVCAPAVHRGSKAVCL